MERATKRRKAGMPPELMEELVEEVLLRFPPEDPASLVRAALVCKFWCRLVCGTAFRRRFREFHRNRAPLLGVVYTGDCRRRHDVDDDTPAGDTGDDDPPVKPGRIMPVSPVYFVPMTSLRPRRLAFDGHYSRWRAIDARHGRVLLDRGYPWPSRPTMLSVWDLVTDEQRDLPELPFDTRHRYSAAVACAATATDTAGGSCNHIHCHREPFLVVVIGYLRRRMMSVAVYSSEAGAWSQRVDFERPTQNFHEMFVRAPSVLVGSALFFLVHSNNEIVKYDLATREVSQVIQLPSKFHDLLKQRSIVLITDDHGGLGFVIAKDDREYQLEFWSMVAGGDAGFVLTRVINLLRLLPADALIPKSPQVSGFADGGASRFLLMRTSDGLYSIEINSSETKKVANCCDNDKVVLPYVSFCTPSSRGTGVYRTQDVAKNKVL